MVLGFGMGGCYNGGMSVNVGRVATVVAVMCAAASLAITPETRADGTFARVVAADGTEAPFATGEWAGPTLMAQERLGAKPSRTPPEGIVWTLTHAVEEEAIVLRARVENRRAEAWRPLRLALRVGVDCWMTHWPQWRTRFVPTFLRCERTHFYGYAQSPEGLMLGVASPDPVASWTLLFNDRGHRIQTFDLDLLSSAPQPDHHPVGCDALAPGQTRTWEVRLAFFRDVPTWRAWARAVTQGPIPEIPRHIFTDATAPVRFHTPVAIEGREGRRAEWALPAGAYRAVAANGKTATFSLFRPEPLSRYLRWARAEALRIPPTQTHHAESVYPFYSLFLARRLLPEPALDAQGEALFQDLFPKHYDRAAGRLRVAWRIQDSATWAGILAARHAATGDADALLQAARLCDYLISTQGEDGGFYAPTGARKTHYSAVIYPLKSILEVAARERALGATDPAWAARATRHEEAVRRAAQDLAARLDNIETEGEQTFEDGMISCALAQLAFCAHALGAPEETRRAWCAAAEELWGLHRCLTLSETPDARAAGATLRWWETQYTVCLMANCLNSPCGWTAWKLYGNLYLYLITGDERCLTQYFDGLGACLQLFDHATGRLRWGFTPSPAIHARYAAKAPEGAPREFVWKEGWFGETYIAPISD